MHPYSLRHFIKQVHISFLHKHSFGVFFFFLIYNFGKKKAKRCENIEKKWKERERERKKKPSCDYRVLEGARKLLALDGFARKRRLRFSDKKKAGLVRTCNVRQ